MKKIVLVLLGVTLLSCNSKAQDQKEKKENFEVTKTEAQWKAELTELQFQVLRKEATEPPFSLLRARFQ